MHQTALVASLSRLEVARLDELQVGLYHLAAELGDRRARSPPQLRACLSAVAEQLLHLSVPRRATRAVSCRVVRHECVGLRAA
eukprot:6697149-Prymnesium_polylepis.1